MARTSPETLADALQTLHETDADTVPITDEQGNVVALLSRPALAPPPRLGGMATPLGVYLTDGNVSGGAGTAGLVLTGCAMALVSVLAQGAANAAAHTAGMAQIAGVVERIGSPVLRAWLMQLTQTLVPMLTTLALVFTLLRLLPLSGIHAAEHQTVHCIEKRLPLSISNIRRMPRVHPRCGTNLVTGLLLFQCVFVSVFTLCTAAGYGSAEAAGVGALCAAPTALLFWRKVGGWVQLIFATRTATDGQILGAIKAAEEVLARRSHAGGTKPRFGRQNARMMGRVFAGYALVLGTLSALSHVFPHARFLVGLGF